MQAETHAQAQQHQGIFLGLPLADSTRIYKIPEIIQAFHKLDPQASMSIKKTYAKMVELGETRLLVKPSNSSCLDGLAEACPNFSAVIKDLRKTFELAILGDEAASPMPILLLGDPGVGKTYFAKELSKVLQTSYEFCSFATMTASWILTGSASSWKDAKMGKVANVLIDKPYANPVIVLDELDKAMGGQYDPTGALYQLFERETAQEFKDEFLDIEMDASRVTWICTANDASRISSPILSRMQVYEIPSPTPEQARHIAQRMYGGMLKEHTKWAFESELHDDALEALSRIAPREMKKKLLGALGEACLAHRDFITADDFGGAAVKTKQSIGFL